MSPLSNSNLNSEQLTLKESFFPLHAFICEKCFLVQLEEFQTPDNIFSDYAYFSSYSTTWLKHAKDFVKMMIPRFKINMKSNVIEIASNDGYLLQFFQENNIPVLGIEPAKNVAEIAKKKRIPTINKFFGEKTAIELSKSKKKADILIGNNVLAHVPNLNDFVLGLKILLNSGGIITLEFPHLLQLIQHNQFDTIYHEHFSYFSFISVQKILSFHKLTIFDVEELSTHGGSLRIFVCHDDEKFIISNNVQALIQKEQKFGLDKIETYVNFQQNVNHLKNHLQTFFVSAKKENKTMIGFGAPAKGNTLLNFCKIGTNFLDYVVDNNPHKQGLFLPGTHIPIFSPQKIHETKPDYIIILPWNLKNEIIEQTNFIKKWGGKHVLLIPKIEILT
jgi:2-polyprenyl-3-methyl-5-hydroxy-6-metoxy-1,4-benzoquinol methylase|tara:strand:+ start:210 stop:1379 length:1170 start_codon:yes stop_codon:yes gene_type:complete